MARQRVRQNQVRPPDAFNDQLSPTAIANASAESLEDFDALILSQMRQMMGTTNWNDNVPISLIDLIESGNAADAKAGVNLATIANLDAVASGNGIGKTLTGSAHGLLTIDGVDVVAGWRILVKNQDAAKDNGIYTVTAEGDAGTSFVLTRAHDFDKPSTVTHGAYTVVTHGNANVGTSWVLTNDTAIDLDTTALTFIEVGTTGSGSVKVPLQATNTAPIRAANSAALQAALDQVANSPELEIELPKGEFYFQDTIVVNQPIRMRGAGEWFRNGTQLYFPQATTMLQINTQGGPHEGARGTIIDSISFTPYQGVSIYTPGATYVVGDVLRPLSGHATGLLYRVSVAGVAGAEPMWPLNVDDTITSGAVTLVAEQHFGIDIKCRCSLRNVIVAQAHGHGVNVAASVSEGDEASVGNMHNVRVSESFGHGFLFDRADANAWSVLICDATQNQGVGFYDSSFLGNNFDSCHAAANVLGSFFLGREFDGTYNANTRARALNCYVEGGQPAALQVGRALPSRRIQR